MAELKEQVCWNVVLSSGERFTENSGHYVAIAGKLSPWQRLMQYIRSNNLTITSLYLTSDKKAYYLLQAEKYPDFKPFRELEPPVDFDFKRFLSQSSNKHYELYTVAIAIYSDYEIQLWVDENNTDHSWVLARNYGR